MIQSCRRSVRSPLLFRWSFLVVIGVAVACAGPEDSASVSSDFTGYQYLSGYTTDAFKKDFSPGLLVVSQETAILQGQGRRIIGSAANQGYCSIEHNSPGITEGFAILPKNIDFMHFTEPGEADVLAVRIRLSEYAPYTRRVYGLSSFTLYCQHIVFDSDQTMPTAAGIAAALTQGASGSYIKFIPSSSPLSGPALTPQ
jgi:hypothetical protein